MDCKYLSSTTNKVDSPRSAHSTLGNVETPLLKQRPCMPDQGGRAGTTAVFLGKSLRLDGRSMESAISEDIFLKANRYIRKVGTMLVLSSHCHLGMTEPFGRPFPYQ